MQKNNLFKELLSRGLAAATVLLTSFSSYPQEKWPAESESLLQASVQYTINQEYDRALAAIDRAIALAPHHPLGHLFRAATLQSMMLDYEDNSEEKEFYRSLKKCRELAEKHLRQRPNDAAAHFFLGSAYGYESFHVSKHRRYLEAFHHGLKTIRHLEAAIRLDSTLYDAYLGIGSYKYYRSKLSKKLPVPLFSDERAAGIHMIRQAIAHGRYARYPAMNGLTWILLAEDRPQEAYALADSALRQFPNSRFFLWGAAESAARLGRHAQALAFYRQIMTTLQQEQKLSPYLEAVCRTKMARVNFQAGQTEAGCKELATASGLHVPHDDWHKDIKKEIADLQPQCIKASTASNGHSTGR
ncbi:MAG: hypothetical protein ONB48_17715 [candidate division KSB1 bacterium]|nr:hypothetical protein [candidate division KSB1 bacterium]MDZ7275313.1 hypothetical protein [candidate division KSB1 bacterium]MDZ7287481.1 hypothetical protein [candidate division KSB1 bacterium]MDZ7299595.1 hypothetical protein [candidate division KSB1 bacterium]MDZ7307467.1 hypothetical protein [candidate division KSB1 bacterium]